MTSLLREISANTRGYTNGPGFTNATYASPSILDTVPIVDAVFSPPLTAVRVNTLWFASLVFSLATASFGMLVKQWLREYLAFEFTSPQARLRIRQRRNPGMRVWKVYTIAAMLPLLLQISLVLFFIGLCFFTWSIDATVARTTTILVCAWAFLFLTSIVLPIFYPACPYRTTAFLRLTIFLRSKYYISRRFVSKACSNLASARFVSRRAPWLRPVLESMDTVLDRAPYKEEREIVKEGGLDVNVLLSVDAALTDDYILGTTIWDSVRQLQLPPNRLLSFIFVLLGHRLPLFAPHQYDSDIPLLVRPLDLRALSSQGWEAVIEIAASVLAREIDKSVLSDWQTEMKNALLVLFSYSSYSLPPRHLALVRKCFEDHNWPAYRPYIESISMNSVAAQGQILRLFREALSDDAFPHTLVLTQFTRLATTLIGGQHDDASLWRIFDAISRDDPQRAQFLCEALTVLANITSKAVSDHRAPAARQASLQTVTHLLYHFPVPAAFSDDFRGVFRHLCSDAVGMHSVLVFLAGSTSVPTEWTLEHVTERTSIIFYQIFDDKGKLPNQSRRQ